MNVLVTGATGFIGRHVVDCLLKKGHQVTAVARNSDKAQAMPWFDRVRFLACDIHQPEVQVDLFGPQDAVIHLAWPGLPNYKSLVHIEETLPADYRFLKKLVGAGIKHLVIAGTCFEYGMQNGELTEDMATLPVTPYGLAKDTLRKFLQALQESQPFRMQWARLFYTYGEGQNPNSLLAQLNRTINSGEKIFNMSGGEQLRDYLPVEDIASCLVALLEHPNSDGVVNICSGIPVSVRTLVEDYLTKRGTPVTLNLGHYPYPVYEPMAFWGSVAKLNQLFAGRP
ncbi:MAG: NAD-dependent epimerase/dehydratase family protein [Pedobacter sp.]